VWTLRHAADLGERRGSGGARADAAPGREPPDGCDRQAAARERGLAVRAPARNYQPYWERLRALDYAFLREAERVVSIALRFTLAAPGVHTAIVGTKRPERWPENARLLEAGPLPAAEFELIRTRWRKVAQPSWTGEV
jgi:aryl-alcohol dehydrogenase-like predicted oxidoreductase